MEKSWLNLEGKSIIVTGGASGIGYATAQELLYDGAYVTVCDIAPERNSMFRRRASYVQTDVR